MKIGIIGAGNVGGSLARSLVAVGHNVVIAGAHVNSQRAMAVSAELGVTQGSVLDAVAAELVVLAVPFGSVDALFTTDVVAAMAGRVVVDPTNPMSQDFMALTVGFDDSAAEQIARRLPGAHVVKAFNTVLAPHPIGGEVAGRPVFVPVAGDDAEAKRQVISLVQSLGFDAVDAGALRNARFIEPQAELLVHLAYAQGLGGGIGWTLVR